MSDPFVQKTDEELRHEKVAIEQALLHRAELRRRQRGEPAMPVGNGDALEVIAPGGWGGRVKGVNAIVLVLLAAALGTVVYLAFGESRASASAHAVIVEELQNQTYILTLTEPERKALELVPPPSLAARMRRNLRPGGTP